MFREYMLRQLVSENIEADELGQKFNDLRRSEQWKAASSFGLSVPGGILSRVPDNTLGPRLKIVGEIRFEQLLRIDGRFQGSLKGNGSIIIGPSGCVTADLIDLEHVYIEGRLTGNIVNANEVEVRGSAIVTGNIKCASLLLDPAVRISGSNVTICPEGPFPIMNAPNKLQQINSSMVPNFSPDPYRSDGYTRRGSSVPASLGHSQKSRRQSNYDETGFARNPPKSNTRISSNGSIRAESEYGRNSPVSSSSSSHIEWISEANSGSHNMSLENSRNVVQPSDSEFDSESTGDFNEWIQNSSVPVVTNSSRSSEGSNVHSRRTSESSSSLKGPYPVPRRNKYDESRPVNTFGTGQPLDGKPKYGELRNQSISKSDFGLSESHGKNRERPSIMERAMSSRLSKSANNRSSLLPSAKGSDGQSKYSNENINERTSSISRRGP